MASGGNHVKTETAQCATYDVMRDGILGSLQALL